MRAIRASELGAFLYCRRAWWYQQQGVTPQNDAEISAGSLYHRQHGQRVLLARLMRLAGWVTLLAAMTIVTIALTIQLLP